MPAQTANLFLLDELDDVGRTSELPEGDLVALRTVADWVKNFIIKPNKELGREGPVCPFVPGALERQKLWLAPERVADLSVPDVVKLMTGYQALFQKSQPANEPDASRAAIMVVFTDLSSERARGLFDEALGQLAAPSYTDDGIIFGPFYEGHEGTAIHNAAFHPFRSPVPFIFVRYGIVEDWPFFIEDKDWLPRYAHRFGEPAVHALAGELHRFPWRTPSPE